MWRRPYGLDCNTSVSKPFFLRRVNREVFCVLTIGYTGRPCKVWNMDEFEANSFKSSIALLETKATSEPQLTILDDFAVHILFFTW
jgi:hypothetical protein